MAKEEVKVEKKPELKREPEPKAEDAMAKRKAAGNKLAALVLIHCPHSEERRRALEEWDKA